MLYLEVKIVNLEDIVFWILIVSIIGIALWLLSGSPTEINALISLALFVAGSEVMLWKKLFELDKKAAISYARVRDDLEELKSLIKKR